MAIPLTPRQRELLALAAEGVADKEIAARLGIDTVESHWKKLRERFDQSSRAEAALREANERLEEKVRQRTRLIADKMNELTREAQSRKVRLAHLEQAMEAVEKSGLTVVIADPFSAGTARGDLEERLEEPAVWDRSRPDLHRM